MDTNDYVNKLQYPNRSDFVKFNLYKDGKVHLQNGSSEDVSHIIDVIFSKNQALANIEILARNKGFLLELIDDKIGFKSAKEKYNQETSNLIAKFKVDLEKEFDTTDNPKAKECYDLAWQWGHSSGLSEVYNYYYDLVDLIK